MAVAPARAGRSRLAAERAQRWPRRLPDCSKLRPGADRRGCNAVTEEESVLGPNTVLAGADMSHPSEERNKLLADFQLAGRHILLATTCRPPHVLIGNAMQKQAPLVRARMVLDMQIVGSGRPCTFTAGSLSISPGFSLKLPWSEGPPPAGPSVGGPAASAAARISAASAARCRYRRYSASAALKSDAASPSLKRTWTAQMTVQSEVKTNEMIEMISDFGSVSTPILASRISTQKVACCCGLSALRDLYGMREAGALHNGQAQPTHAELAQLNISRARCLQEL